MGLLYCYLKSINLSPDRKEKAKNMGREGRRKDTYHLSGVAKLLGDPEPTCKEDHG
jgi:hypothetical protein